MSAESKPLVVVRVTLDRPRALCLSLRSLKRYATASGKDVFRDGSAAIASIEDFRLLIWSMARETDAAVTLGDLSKHITTSVVIDVGQAIKTIAHGDVSSRQADFTKN